MPLNNIGLIAAGSIGKMYCRLINTIPGLNLKTVVDKYESKESLAEQGISAECVTSDPDKLYSDSSISKVIVASSTTSHALFCEKLIESGKHILCEKPLSFDPRVIEQIGQKAENRGIMLQVGYVRRFDPNFQNLKERLDNKTAGALYMIKIVNRDPIRPAIKFVKKSGGIFIDFLVHDFDMLYFLTNAGISKIYVEADVKIDPELRQYNDYDTVLITAKLSDGTLVSVDCSRECGYGYDQRIEVFGSNACLRVENIPADQVVSYAPQGVSSSLPLMNYQERYKDAFKRQLLSFIHNADNTKKTPVSCGDAARNIIAANACIQSIKEGRPITL